MSAGRWFFLQIGLIVLWFTFGCDAVSILEPTVTNIIFPDSSTSIIEDDPMSISILISPTPVPVETPSPSPPPLPPPPPQITINQANLSMDFVGDGICRCDLLVNICDVFCCCDSDCSPSSKMIFNCSATSSSTDVCLDTDSIFRTALVRCECPDSSLLCVVSELDPSRSMFRATQNIETTEQFSNLLVLFSTRGGNILRTVQHPTYGSFYLVGDALRILRNSTYFDVLSLPAPFNGLQCHDRNPITYLINDEYQCNREILDLSSACSSLLASVYFEDFHILGTPDNINDTILMEIDIQCRTNTSKISPCQYFPPNFELETEQCNNALLQVNYTLFHDGGGKLINTSAIIIIGDIKRNETLIQTFVVKFIEIQDIDSEMLMRSGNPGYLQGQVILAGSLTEMSEVNITVDNTFWLHIMDSARNCFMNRSRLPILFLQDIFSTCLLIVTSEDILSDCDEIRSMAYSVLTSDYPFNFVGKFGNSDPLNISQWVQIINSTVEADEQESSPYLCSNVPIALDITILFSYDGELTDPQAVLSGVRFLYSTQNIAYEFLKKRRLIMQTAVTFIDISSEPNEIIKSIQGTVMELPMDFLYPFFVSYASFVSFHALFYIMFSLLATITLFC